MANPRFLLFTLPVLMLLSSVSNFLAGAAVQDVLGGASLIFIARPKNPPVRHKAGRANKQQNGQPSATSTPGSKNENAVASNDMSDEIEDALELGNSARDAEPPRYEDAEKAYKLAAKLGPKDPRPYMGLANIWYDQKHFEEAAKTYRQAAQLMASTNAAGGRISRKLTVRGGSSGATAAERGELRAYLGNALLQQAQFSEAEVEFRKAVGYESNNAHWQALLGYSLLQQKKYPEASSVLKVAVKLAPENAEYKKLLDDSRLQLK